MKQVVYYGALVVLLFVCMFGISFLMVCVEDIFKIKLGQMLMNFGFLLGIGLFFAIKPYIRKWLQQDSK